MYCPALLPHLITDHFPDALHDSIDDLLPDGVMSSSVVVGRVLLSRDQLLRMEELSVLPNPHFVWREKFNSEKAESNWMSVLVFFSAGCFNHG